MFDTFIVKVEDLFSGVGAKLTVLDADGNEAVLGNSATDVVTLVADALRNALIQQAAAKMTFLGDVRQEVQRDVWIQHQRFAYGLQKFSFGQSVRIIDFGMVAGAKIPVSVPGMIDGFNFNPMNPDCPFYYDVRVSRLPQCGVARFPENKLEAEK